MSQTFLKNKSYVCFIFFIQLQKKKADWSMSAVLNSSPRAPPPPRSAYCICYSYRFRCLFYSNVSALRSGHHRIFHHDSSSNERIYSIQSALKCARRELKLYIFTEVYDVTLVRAWRRWTLCREHVNGNTVHAWSALLTSWLSESGVLKRDMQNMQSGGDWNWEPLVYVNLKSETDYPWSTTGLWN